MKSLRMFSISAVFVAIAATMSFAGGGGPIVAPATLRPEAQGDQVVSYYDAREGFTTFLSLRNATDFGTFDVQVVFYSGGFSVPFTRTVTLDPGQLRVLDIGALREEGLPAQPGVALAFAVNDEGSPIVTRSLTGNFTVANLATGSAWGGPGAARFAVVPLLPEAPVALGDRPSGVLMPYLFPIIGSVVDGIEVVYQPIQPTALDLAAYFDPDDLAPVAQSGNQVIFLSFADQPGLPYSVVPASTVWGVYAARNDGTQITATSYGASGVEVADLASVAGPEVDGASGSIRFSAIETEQPITRLIFFAEALGTFGTGYLLPTVILPIEFN